MTDQIKTVTAYDDFRAQLAGVKDTCNFIPNVSTDDGYAKSKRISLDVGKILTAVEKTRKELKSESLAFGKMIDAEAKGIVAELESFQLPHKDAYKELDGLKKEREANRKAELDERVRVIRELPEAMADSDSEGVKMALESLQVEECLDFYEYTAEALKARNASKEKLSAMFAEKLQQEKDAAELVKLREKQAEQDQKDRDERIAKEASEKADKAAAAAKEAEQRAIDQAALAVRLREEAESRATLEAEQAQRDKAEARRESDQAIIDAAQAAREKAELVQRDKEAREKADREKREANTKHIGKIRKEAKEAIMKLGGDEALAKSIVMAISNGIIPNVVINY